MEIRIVIDDRIVAVARRARALLNRRNVVLGVLAALMLTSAVSYAADLVKPHTFAAGDKISAADINANFDALYEAMNERVIRDEITIPVSAEDGCAGINAAIADLDQKTIAVTGAVKIELAATAGSITTYACTQELHIRHANADRITLAGQTGDPADVVLTFPPGSYGIVLSNGGRVRGIEGITLSGGGTNVGLIVQHASEVTLTAVTVRGFQDGIYCQQGSIVSGSATTTVDNSRFGVVASGLSLFNVTGAVSNDNGETGFYSADNSYMQLSGATANGNASGFRASNGATLWAAISTATDNSVYGFYADDHAFMNLHGATATGGTTGIVAESGAYIRLRDTTTGTTNITPNVVSADGTMIAQ